MSVSSFGLPTVVGIRYLSAAIPTGLQILPLRPEGS